MKYEDAYNKRLEKLNIMKPCFNARNSAWISFLAGEFELNCMQSELKDIAAKYGEGDEFLKWFYKESLVIYNMTHGKMINKVFYPLIAAAVIGILLLYV